MPKQLPRSIIQRFADQINALSAHGQSVLLDSLTRIDLTDPDVAKVRRQVVGVMDSVCGVSTSGVGQLSASFYNSVRQYELGQTIRTTTDTGRNPQATEGAVKAFAQKLVDEEYEEFERLCAERVDYECKVAAAQTCINNAKRDPKPPRFARVPTGAETCGFCIMLASRGFVYWSEESAGAFDHYHPHCDCMVVPSFDSMASDIGVSRRVSPTEVEGYDPDAYYDDYLRLIADPSFARSMANAADRAHAAHGRTRSGSRGRRERSPQLTLTPQQVEGMYARLNAAENDKVALGDVYLEIIRELMARPETTDADFTNIADHYAYLLEEYFRKHK